MVKSAIAFLCASSAAIGMTAAFGQPTTKNEIILGFAGDCTFGSVNGDDSSIRFPSMYIRSGDPDYPFAKVRSIFKHDNLTIVNFECTLTNATKTADKQWKFKGDASYASIFANAGISAVSLANNHSFDYLQPGFDDTVRNFTKAHVPVAYQDNPFQTTVKETPVIVIADCTVVGENTTVIDGTPARVIAEIKKYKRPDNIVVVFMHWGSELDPSPRPWQQSLGREFIDSGADAVVGAHPHVLQGIECYKGRYIAYSLGNFAFGGNSLARHPQTVLLRLKFLVDKGITRPSGLSVVPCLTTSTDEKNGAGILINNYQPAPLSGAPAFAVNQLIIDRSSVLKSGVKAITIDRR